MRDRASKYCFHRFKCFNSINSHNYEVAELFSPAMRRDVAYHIYGKVLEQVPMFRMGEKSFVTALAHRLLTSTYSPMEYIFDEVRAETYYAASSSQENGLEKLRFGCGVWPNLPKQRPQSTLNDARAVWQDEPVEQMFIICKGRVEMEVHADAEHVSHSKHSAALRHQTLELSFRYVLKPSLLRTVRTGGRLKCRIDPSSSL